MPELLSTVAGLLSDIGVEVGKKYLKKNFDELKLKEALCSYIEKQRKYNEICTLSEEMDFQGLAEYIQNNLIDDVINRIEKTDPKDRKLARKTIIEKAVLFSQARTDESRAKVTRIIDICIEIIINFFRKKIDAQYYILASDVIDNINEHIDTTTEKMIFEFKNTSNKIVSKISETALSSDDIFSKKVEVGNFDYANDVIKEKLNLMTYKHPLFPHYGVNWNNDCLVSVPLSVEATMKYPINYSFKGPIKLRGVNSIDSISNIFDYSYRHQIKLVMKVEEARKYLGDELDPLQQEVNRIKGKSLYIKPPEFPPAFPCSIKVKDKVMFEYVLMRTQEILDDGTYIISNKEQFNTHFIFEFRANIKDTLLNDKNELIAKGDIGFNININNGTNMEKLKYVKFIKELTTERDLKLHVLDKDQDIFAGKFNGTDYKTGFGDINEEIDFLERICDIEHHFNVSLNLEGDVFEKDYRVIQFVSNLVRNDKVDEIWETVSFTDNLEEKTRENLLNIDNSILAFSCVCSCSVDLFGTRLDFKFFRTFYDAIIDKPEKIKKIVEVSDIGDPIKITLKAVGDKKVTSTLHIPEYMND